MQRSMGVTISSGQKRSPASSPLVADAGDLPGQQKEKSLSLCGVSPWPKARGI
jgi:hypothetical protein